MQCAGDPFNPIPARWDVVTVMGEPSIAVTPRSSSSSLYSSTQCTPLQHFASIFPFSLSSLALLLIIVFQKALIRPLDFDAGSGNYDESKFKKSDDENSGNSDNCEESIKCHENCGNCVNIG